MIVYEIWVVGMGGGEEKVVDNLFFSCKAFYRWWLPCFSCNGEFVSQAMAWGVVLVRF